MKGFTKRLLNVLAWAFAIFWIAFAGISMVYVIAAGRSPTGPELFGHRFMMVLSDSMVPTMRAGDMVVGIPPKPGEIQVGDIVTYRNHMARRLITHRVIEVTQLGSQPAYITQGDANDINDGNPVLARDVVAVYSFRIPYAGYLLGLAQSWVGLVVLIIIPSLVLMSSEIIRLTRLIRSEREQPRAG
ncbi:MAG: signal peptidase I [Bacillota bacterium]